MHNLLKKCVFPFLLHSTWNLQLPTGDLQEYTPRRSSTSFMAWTEAPNPPCDSPPLLPGRHHPCLHPLSACLPLNSDFRARHPGFGQIKVSQVKECGFYSGMPKRLRSRQWDEQLPWGRWAPRTTGRNQRSRAGSWVTVRTFASRPDAATSGKETEEVKGVILASGLFLKEKVALGKPRTLNQRRWRPLNSSHVYLPVYHVFHKHVDTQPLTHFKWIFL